MKKRIMSLALAVICLVGMVGCSGSSGDGEKVSKKDMIKELETAMKKTNEADSNAGTMELEMKAEVDDESEEITMNYDFIFNNLGDMDKLEGMMELDMTMSKTNQKATVYIKDGNVYMEMSGYKVKMDDSEFTELDSLQEQTNLALLVEEQIDSIKMKKDGDDKIVTIELKDDEIKELVMEQMEDTMGSSSFDEENMDIKNYKIKYVINKDGYIKEQDITFKVTMEYLGEKGEVSMAANIKYDSFKNKDIDFPDFKDFKDMNN
ncbi:hypothetical protein M2475_001647 [Breznakia sp. PF5-3]|uniref:DUF6612 family protein n=1 Tax=unclassified Breznakia TaxID=2623764 RepID=UPI00240519A7|nr:MULTISPECIES: DUF6612 family protein [unclassified Breznakia]MDL2276866.1 hypothetical protein [Breznakia sp. OttesenSCG-928-G09]MDF9825690.1 hypothetical protein [Breznakia sp. PM6-1]MDF9836071.1 hypothetical protein [Breznakia sp. PF5-3]MDF9838290.1 hypothetical protein [Breznakia sp. PFB2-8]MDF9860314.1 hypothetical protein [Breznakia sp. PH5-24]